MVDHTSTMYPDTRTGAHLDPAQLRTVPPPDLRTPAYDTRTEQEKVRDALVRIVDALQALTLRVEELERGRG